MDLAVAAVAPTTASAIAAAAAAALAPARGAGTRALPSAASAAPAPVATSAAAASAAPRLSLQELMDRAQALQQAAQPEQAAALYEAWLADTDSPLRHVACFNWGTLLSSLGRSDAAEAAYQQGLAHQPGFAPAQLNLGHLLERRGDHAGALAHWRGVFDAEPPASTDLQLHALNNSARLLETLRRYPDSEALMRRSLQLKAAQADVIQHYVHIRQKQCAWPHDLAVGEVTPNQFLTGTSLLAMMGLSDDPALQLLAAQRFVHEKVPAAPAVPLHTRTPPRSGKVRIGYLSGDLHMHAVGLLTPELFELHDRSRFEVWAFCWTPESQQPQRRRILHAMDRLVRLNGLDDASAAQLIAQAGIDVLVDLQGLTSGARPGILVQRPAPVQVSYLGLPGTSAVPGIDWMIADRFVMPPSLLPYCTEKPMYLPRCYQVSDRQREVAPLPDPQSHRARYGLPAGAFVFCSFNNNHKFTAEMFSAWMRIVAAVPSSVLWLLADNDTARENMLRQADAHGVARERLVFAPRVSPAEYLARFTLADLMLDTFPFNAGTTASDALWMGTPIVTRTGRTYISRMAGSLLTAVGLPDLITDDLAGYERLAITLGREPARVASYKRYLAEHGRASPLFDMPQIVRDIEAQFEHHALAARAVRGA
jgi:predicted O-linked N-acetylglucosamine transferase (SPINDLY family)